MTQYVLELLRHRDLLFWLAVKEIKVRYKLPLLGILWALLAPLCLSLMLWLVFTTIMPIPMARYPFFLFLLTGMFPWSFFAQSVSHATTSMLDAGALIRKTAFPRALVPLAIVAAHAFNFLIALGVVVAIVVLWGVPVSPWIWLLPAVMGLHLALTTGVAFLVAGLQVRYRDTKYLTELGLVLWFYLTPIFYPLELVAGAPPVLRTLYFLNPLVGIVELYRLTLLGSSSGAGLMSVQTAWGLAAISSPAVFLLGLAGFRRHEPAFADWATS